MPAIRIVEFDTWRPGYGLAEVTVLKAGTEIEADIFSDETLQTTADNPQTLLEKTVNDISYGKFAIPIYVGTAYELRINTVDRTGVTRVPLITLAGEDASKAYAVVAGGTEKVNLEDHLARRIDVRDFGPFVPVGMQNASAATNNATLTAAIGAAGALGGGYVEVPAGTYQFTTLTLPQGVVLRGVGREATILQTTIAGNAIEIEGKRAGFARISIDGITLVANSRGVFAREHDELYFDDVEIKRFETGLRTEGGHGFNWRELYIRNCVNGYRGYGFAGESVDAPLNFNRWSGGKVETCSAVGVELKHDGASCSHFVFSEIGFDANTAKAVRIIGARDTVLRDCWWDGNGDNLTLEDGNPLTAENTVIGVLLDGGSIAGGTMMFGGNLERVVLRRMTLQDVAVTITTPGHNVVLEDCREIAGVTVAGAPTAWIRTKTHDGGSSSGLTTGNAATKAWSIALKPGQRVYLEAKVVARARNNTNDAFYHLAVSARRPGASLSYDTQTGNFTAGNIVTGQTSGATARIIADSDSGATGTLTLQDVVGVFLDNEIITDGASGSATVNGALVTPNAELAGTVTKLRADQEADADFDATFVANGPEIELRVTGDSNQTIEWIVDVDVVTS